MSGPRRSIVVQSSSWAIVHLLVLGLALLLTSGQFIKSTKAIDLARLYGHVPVKRTDGESCHPYKPFKCPEDNTCISIQYLCDGAPDCREGYDEDPRLCTAGERPFKCNHTSCGKDFKRKEELTRHERIHTGEKPYVCTICEKKFGRKDHLNQHKETHAKKLYQRSHPIAPLTEYTFGSYMERNFGM